MAEVQEKAARLADVAKAAGVSQGTVSNVFNRPEIVREEVREHVRGVAKQLGYRGPDPKGRLLRAGKVNAIGIAASEPLDYFFTDPFARELMRGISDECDARGAGLSLVSARNAEGLAWNVQSALVDGFVLLCIEGGERLVELTRERQLPFVALALGRQDDTISAIGIDDFTAAKQAAQHLLDLGHRRFGVLALDYVDNRTGVVTEATLEGATYSTTRDRTLGYFSALEAAGIRRDDVPVYETANHKVGTIAGLQWMFEGSNPPTALLAMSDKVAIEAIEWVKGRGLSVPGDVSVVGFDGVPEAALAEPPLTTIAQPIAEIGRRAVQMILEPSPRIRRETLPTELVLRATTAPPRRG
ncbi:MAG: substrate-binding domain-containing protein [Devosia sp.]